MAHVAKRHGILQLAQTFGMDLILQQIHSGDKGLQDALIRDSAKLLGSKFSRDHERAADDLGWELLQQAQINPQGMVDFFEVIKVEMDTKGPGGFALGANLLSTHPTPQERIDRLRQRQADLAGREFKSSAHEFRDLQTSLGIMMGMQ
jgi:predicted Zn-dependent protease